MCFMWFFFVPILVWAPPPLPPQCKLATTPTGVLPAPIVGWSLGPPPLQTHQMGAPFMPCPADVRAALNAMIGRCVLGAEGENQ